MGRCFGQRRATDAHDAGERAGALESGVQLMLMMLGCGPVLWKSRAADAHDAGVWAAAGKLRRVWAGAVQAGVRLMLMMLGCGLVLWKAACS